MGELLTGAPLTGLTTGDGFGLYAALKRPFFGRFMKPWRWPEGVDAALYQRLQIRSPSGSLLSAVSRRAATAESRGVVVFAHPMGLAAKGFWLKYGHADAFAAEGYDLIAFDFNGFGESPSANFDYAGDVIAVAEAARRLFPRRRLAVVGASFGAMRALEAASQATELFDAVVAEAAAPTLSDFWKHYRLPYATLRASMWLYPAWERKLRPTWQLSKAERLPPILLIHSATDRWTPPEFGESIERAIGGRSQVRRMVIPLAEHTHAFRDARGQYAESVFAFLATHFGNSEIK